MAKKTKPPKRPVPLTDLEEHLREQLAFLSKSALDFDRGDRSEFKRMAVAIRTLLHDGPSSHSLAGLLDLKSGKFAAYGHEHNPHNLLSEFCLAAIMSGPDGVGFVPNLDIGQATPRRLPFEIWWTEVVLKDTDGVVMSRRDLVLVVANQAGGAHVDPEIDERYHRLAKEHSIGWVTSSGPPGTNPGIPLVDIEKVYLRHIAFEVLATLQPLWDAIVGNRGCDCGSGRKARYCCLKAPPL